MRHPKPYIVETAAVKSLHFTPEETQSRMWKREPDSLVFDYTRLMTGFLLWQPSPCDIAMVGLGGGSLAKFCHRWLPDARIDVAEINPHVIALRDAFHVPPDDRRLTVREADGVAFVGAARRRYDALLVDGYDHAGMPARLRSREFLADCRAALRADGVFVANLNSDDPHVARFLERTREAFGGEAFAAEDSAGGNRIVFAGAAGRRIGAIERPAALDRDAWAQVVLAFVRIRAAQHDWLTQRTPPR